jgi:hypothetical protein
MLRGRTVQAFMILGLERPQPIIGPGVPSSPVRWLNLAGDYSPYVDVALPMTGKGSTVRGGSLFAGRPAT